MRVAPASVSLPTSALELASHAAQGDAVATRKLLEHVAPRVVRAARAAMGSHHPDLEDVVQLALIGFVQALASFRGECDPALFAARIAVRTAWAARKRYRAKQSGRDLSSDVDELEGPHVTEGASRRRAVVRELLDQLPEEQAEALACRFMLGWSLAEIAQASGVPTNTVRSRLRLAKEAVRRRIGAEPTLALE